QLPAGTSIELTEGPSEGGPDADGHDEDVALDIPGLIGDDTELHGCRSSGGENAAARGGIARRVGVWPASVATPTAVRASRTSPVLVTAWRRVPASASRRARARAWSFRCRSRRSAWPAPPRWR